MTLRDTSGSGLGGMYVGDDVLNPTAAFVLRDAEEDEERRVRIVCCSWLISSRWVLSASFLCSSKAASWLSSSSRSTLTVALS